MTRRRKVAAMRRAILKRILVEILRAAICLADRVYCAIGIALIKVICIALLFSFSTAAIGIFLLVMKIFGFSSY